MSLERWRRRASGLTVRPNADQCLVIRPRRLANGSGVVMGTHAAIGLAWSAALLQFQEAGWPSPMVLLTIPSSLVWALIPQVFKLRNHPERWRFLGWWAALVLSKMPFLTVAPVLIMLPLELALLVPAYIVATRSARLANLEFQGVEVPGLDVSHVQIARVDFSGANLRSAVFRDVKFEHCRFNGIAAEGCVFESCQFVQCDFGEARLAASRWWNVDAQGVRFRRAGLENARMLNVDLRDADFESADLCGTLFVNDVGGKTRLQGARLAGAHYSAATTWPDDIAPWLEGAVKAD